MMGPTKRLLVLDALDRAAGQLRRWAALEPGRSATLLDAAREVEATARWIADMPARTV